MFGTARTGFVASSQLDIPKDLKQIQKLTGCVAALSRFISRLGEKALPLYRLLRRTEHFEWTDAATAGLEEIKAIESSVAASGMP